MNRTFDSPATYAPSHSLLGRAVRAWVGDRLRGEALYIVVFTGLILVLLMSHYLGWALLKPVLVENPSWQMLFWGGQVGSVLVLAGVGLLGFRPAVQVRCDPEAVTLHQGDRSCTLSYASITGVSSISARRYHRHHRRYARTEVFLSAVPDEVICLRTDDGPVIVGLSDPEAQSTLLDHLDTTCASAPALVAQASR